ncbi:MAG TPA: DNA mismatch repair endonuclease MutL, partial [Rhodothermales bacterium]|nr:DNA mismatch repair endonuclease MutL [Rhodothermales bacterium]
MSDPNPDDLPELTGPEDEFAPDAVGPQGGGVDAADEAGDVENEEEEAADGLVRTMPDVLANKIAAGEVVQRPSSVAKELLENSIDAGARRVDLILRKAGSALVQVVDDGGGMGPQDAAASFGRHATSKLRSFEDLERLATLGFRGEALASIGAVARVELRTKRRQDPAGTRVCVEGGKLVDRSPVAAEDGTSIAVRDLFYNVPARRAFLKTPATEFRHLVETFQSVALSEPHVAFTLVHDDVEVYRLPAPPPGATFGEALTGRVAALFGGRGEVALVPVGESTSYLSLGGVVGRPEDARRGRADGFFFVNGRVVKSRSLEHAVAAAYGALLPPDRRPFFALFLDVDPRHVDANVHPTKTEVKFADEGGVYAFVRAVVKRGLGAAELALAWEGAADTSGAPTGDGAPPAPEAPGATPRWTFEESRPAEDGGTEGDGADAGDDEHSFVPQETDPRPAAWGTPWTATPTMPDAPAGLPAAGPAGPPLPFDPADPFAETAALPSGPPTGSVGGLRFPARGSADEADLDADEPGERAIWLLHRRYILTPIRSGLLVVDQQAAHERILYERALTAMEGGLAASQQLLFPQAVELDPADFALLTELLSDLRSLGFDLEPTARKTVLVRGVPSEVRVGSEKTILEDLLAGYRRHR